MQWQEHIFADVILTEYSKGEIGDREGFCYGKGWLK